MTVAPLSKEDVLRTVEEMEKTMAWLDEPPPSFMAHGVRAIDVARCLPGRVTWKQVRPLLEKLAVEGELHRCVPFRSVPYFRTVGG